MPESAGLMTISITDTAHGFIDPGSHKNIGNFTTYHLLVTHPDGHTTETRRRYTEFELLHNYLVRSYPYCIIPPIPEKHTFSTLKLK